MFSQTPNILTILVNDGSKTWSLDTDDDLYIFNEWQYMAVVWAPNVGLSVYLNGQVAATQVGDVWAMAPTVAIDNHRCHGL